MEARAVIVVGLIFLLLVGGASFAAFKKGSILPPVASPEASVVSEPSQSPSTSSIPGTPPSGQMMSLKEIWSRGSNQKCTVMDPDTKITGTIYVTQGKMKGDFSASSSATAVSSHVIVQNQQSYVWVEGQNTGVKITVNSDQIGKQASSSSQINLDQKYQVRCENWTQNDSIFALPSNVTFQDMSSVVPLPKASGSPTAVDLKAACGACDKLQGDPRDQCRKALSCQ